MNGFFSRRVRLHQKQMQRYLKYVFNDHFIMILLILVGGAGLYYSNVVQQLNPEFIWAKPITIVILLCVLFIGKFATLLQEADKVFLLPKEKDMRGYLMGALKYSCILPFVLLILTAIALMPLLQAVEKVQLIDLIELIVTLLLLKIVHLLIEFSAFFQLSAKTIQKYQVVWLLTSLVSLIFSLYINGIFGVVLSAILFLFFYVKTLANFKNHLLDWEGMIDKEKRRLHQMYRIINLFTDVPEISSSVKRRIYLDSLLKRISFTHKDTYLYLYARSFLRGTEYSGLYIRLLVIGALIVVFVAQFWVSLIAALIFIYLIGFQLIPLYSQYDYMTMTQLYPISQSEKRYSLESLLKLLLKVVGVIFSICGIIALRNFVEIITFILSIGIEIFLFLKMYVPKRLSKMEF